MPEVEVPQAISLDHGEVIEESDLGSIRRVAADNFPILRSLSIKRVLINPGAMRTPHWHANANELTYCVSGTALVSVLDTYSVFSSFVVSAGEMFHVDSGDRASGRGARPGVSGGRQVGGDATPAVDHAGPEPAPGSADAPTGPGLSGGRAHRRRRATRPLGWIVGVVGVVGAVGGLNPGLGGVRPGVGALGGSVEPHGPGYVADRIRGAAVAAVHQP